VGREGTEKRPSPKRSTASILFVRTRGQRREPPLSDGPAEPVFLPGAPIHSRTSTRPPGGAPAGECCIRKTRTEASSSVSESDPMAHHQGGGMLWETTKSCAVSAPHPCPNVVEFPRSRPRTWGAHPHNPSCEHSTLVARRGGSALYNASILVESGGATAGPVCLRTGPFPAPSLESTTSRKHDL
jgi:hypothetical protein